MDRVRNEEVRMRAGIERELSSRADPRVLRWYGHVERMVLMAEVSGGPGGINQTERTRRWGRGRASDIAICGSLTAHYKLKKNRC